MAIPIRIKKAAILPTMIPTLAPVLRPEEPDELEDVPVAAGTIGVVMAIWVVLNTVPLRPIRVPTAGFCLQPASSATITKKHEQRYLKIVYAVSHGFGRKGKDYRLRQKLLGIYQKQKRRITKNTRERTI